MFSNVLNSLIKITWRQKTNNNTKENKQNKNKQNNNNNKECIPALSWDLGIHILKYASLQKGYIGLYILVEFHLKYNSFKSYWN